MFWICPGEGSKGGHISVHYKTQRFVLTCVPRGACDRKHRHAGTDFIVAAYSLVRDCQVWARMFCTLLLRAVVCCSIVTLSRLGAVCHGQQNTVEGSRELTEG